ncbi:protein Loquacious-like [Mytilus galloprovincialis]|uniref:MG_TARBP2 n=1 Tax=Mytilus galloprovincialis TaxID=29158 RepID=A0A140H124_MYTGA|nr:MG_TARBP2 [Mytilus galloprovincialis]
MAIPAGKTPISYLQELCTRRGITPQYDLMANEGAVHEPIFIMSVTVGDIVSTGKGSSKKKAKHAAAQAALNRILGLPNNETPEVVPENDTSKNDEDGPGNPVGELQEFTQKRLLKPPVYEFSSDMGPPHAREFSCSVKLGKYSEKGTGRSKKEAKRAAALAMLTHIRSLTQDGEEQAVIEEEEEEDDILLSATELRQSYTALKEGKKRVPIPAAKQNKEIQQFYNKIAKVDKKNGKIKNASLTAPSTNYCQMLQEIAEAQRFEVNYLDIEETSHSGLRQCLVQLSTLPVAVLHGSGQNIYDAHAHAAHNALQYLKLMIKS